MNVAGFCSSYEEHNEGKEKYTMQYEARGIWVDSHRNFMAHHPGNVAAMSKSSMLMLFPVPAVTPGFTS